ncbi:unnamed protein product [Echinostoma caproni]|uniref:acid phosphatase n=1 Tax=Echinostoma caproni TaxID=27848 RepID=A0A183B3Q1_9TREM|nr:unnamed protein product [Echinostoma caproni]
MTRALISLIVRLFYGACFLPLVTTTAKSSTDPDVTSTVRFVFTLSRHGDRSPIHRPVHDPYESHWSAGYGQLTSLGVRQQVELGQFVRRQYGAILPHTYHKNFFFFRSSGTSRTIQSATSFIHGLFTSAEQKWDPTVTAAPPLFSMPTKDDRLLKSSSFCPRAKELVDKVFDGPEAAAKVREFGRTIQVLQVLYREYSHLVLGVCMCVCVWGGEITLCNKMLS